MSNTAMAEEARQKSQETDLERESRKAGGFLEIESKMPKRWSSGDVDGMDNLTSLLGAKNPFYKSAHPKDHTIWLLDNTAYRPVHPYPHDVQPWQAEFVTCYFGKSRKDLSKKVAAIADVLGIDGKLGANKVITDRIAQRIQPFCSAIAPARTVAVEIPCPAGQPHVRNLGPSNSNGISSQTILTGGGDASEGSVLDATTVEKWDPPVIGKVRFVGPEGWGVISDIDDSIKYTQTSQAEGILRTTFTEEPQVIAEMPELYKYIKDQFNDPAYFYLSASPYNLYPFLNQFLADNFPGGTLILRDDSWMDLSGLFKSLTQGVQAYKVDRMEKIHTWLPNRKMICVGDSTQSDPEAYGEIYRKYPGWIHAVFIRKVTYLPHMEEKNKPERFTKAFEGVPDSTWMVFENPLDCGDRLKQIAGEAHIGLVGGLQEYFGKREQATSPGFVEQ